MAAIVLVLFIGVWVGIRALVAKDALESAEANLSAFRSALGTSEQSTAGMYERLRADTSAASEAVGDPVWMFAELTPVLGSDLRSIRQLAQLLDELVEDGVGPVAVAVDGLTFDVLRPVGGRIAIEPFTRLVSPLAKLASAMHQATLSAADIRPSGLVPPLADAVQQVKDLLAAYSPGISGAAEVLPHVGAMLGEDEPRHYLLMFQNNAEERASGGNPASMALLEVDRGSVKLVQQASSRDFDRPYRSEPLTFAGDWPKLFGAHTSTYVTNITFTPDFPTTAKLAQRMWELEFGRTVDGVVSFDPVALSHLLRATGPLALATGETLTAENAVRFLLNEVYSKYLDPRVQDVVFASAAAEIFDAVVSGAAEPKPLLEQLQPMIAEQRLKVWSSHPKEQAVLQSSPVGNMLPPDNSSRTVVGVYNNDDATSKMSYYMDSTIAVTADRCRPERPTIRVSTTVTNTLDPETAKDLPAFILAGQPRIPFGGDRQWVLLYGPVGAELSGANVDGRPVVFGDGLYPRFNSVPDATGLDDKRPAVSGVMDGRPVAIVSINLGPLESRTVDAVFAGGDDLADEVSVSHTPKVRDVPVTVSERDCG
ncbi:DUF4012 domain-containing protein [Lysobacter korlensis]|uniref:DUF4012 domain-containing protein n=1 Tax=Lysobacter korlensis TaxID=553636 RepID=A0ABV6RMB4_9GAMM